MQATCPVKRPSRDSGSVAMRCGTRNSRAIGAVTKLLVAVMMAQRSPRSRWRVTSTRAPALTMGRIRLRVRGEGTQREAEVLVDIERAGGILVVVGSVLGLIGFPLEDAAVHQ